MTIALVIVVIVLALLVLGFAASAVSASKQADRLGNMVVARDRSIASYRDALEEVRKQLREAQSELEKKLVVVGTGPPKSEVKPRARSRKR